MVKSKLDRGERGRQLERSVAELFKRYSERGIHCQENHAKQTADGKFVSKHGFDFQVFFSGKFIAFDTKMTEADALPIANLKLHQVNEMRKIENHGGEGFFMIYFVKQNLLVRFDARRAAKFLEEGAKAVKPSDGTILKSVNFLEVE